MDDMISEFPNPVPGDGASSNSPRVEGGAGGSVTPSPDTVEGASSSRVTPLPDMEFAALWRRPELTSADVAERLAISSRAANKRARTLGLPPKGKRATKIQRLRDQLLEAAMPVTDGRPDPRLPWLVDPEVRPEFELYWAKLKNAQTGEDLVRLRPLQIKLHGMLAAKFPWALDTLQTLAESAKLVLCAQKTEADLPVRPDQMMLRQDAARQIMQEVGSVLTKEEQEQMGELLKMAADRLRERRGLAPIDWHASGLTHPQSVAVKPVSKNPW